MIAKHVAVRTESKSRFSRLVEYITDTQRKTERVGEVRISNCYSDDIESAAIEILATQYMNTRATSDKTYHLIISFRSGENVRNEDMAEIEERICTGLGFAGHQRISVVHHDTDNMHIHVAINKIHPKRLTIHNPYYDYIKIAGLCEQLEAEFNLIHDNHTTTNSTVSDIESRTGIESLPGWIRRECLDIIKSTDTWQDLHTALKSHGLEIRERGNGLVFVSESGVAVKASSVDRSLSKSSLVKRLGAFEQAAHTQETARTSQKRKHYQPRPLQNRIDTSKLYARYQQAQSQAAGVRQTAWIMLRNQRDRLIDRAKQKAKLKRTIIKNLPAGRLGKKALYATVSLQFKTALTIIKSDYRRDYAKSKARYPKMSWLDWLHIEAKGGNDEALAVLRSRNIWCGEVTGNYVGGNQNNHNSPGMGAIESITKSGTVIYRIGSTTVRDDGKRLHIPSSAADTSFADILRVAAKRYGNRLLINGDDDFKKAIARAAVQHSIRATFDDPALEQYRRQCMQQQRFTKSRSASKGISL
ncbi:Relaxase/Mobilisation nuclease domain-containing protein [Nitrosomonas aestuarii]|uniref:Relaxase/Mobilisation nuclease domain-containing protein n=1 Tax=Nitrosomonas aestuarii TaxID=52441 RepID=A0A1I4E0Y3_9PROT|nr:TraI/MobA(P) family conjugative relaxase [Nitrosomonas aestuarii]SFK98026.1 Relaxase/Mobilisation nuclease domain-containing protein [Nitrosomonas aestuarii]